TFWQHTDRARYPGIATGVDESYLCCSSGTLAGLADGRTPAIAQAWARLAGASGPLGLPTGAEFAVTGGWAQRFQRGIITWTPRYGAHAVYGPLYTRLVANHGPGGQLGLPIEDQHWIHGGLLQRFSGGALTYSSHALAHAVWGAFYLRWAHEGGPL